MPARSPALTIRLRRALLLFCLCACPWATAHKPSDSYLHLQVIDQQISAQWDIALRDLDYALGLDANQDQGITWGEVRAQHAAIQRFALSRLTLRSRGQVCAFGNVTHLIDTHTDGAYAVLRFTATCPQAVRQLNIDYRLFFDLDPQHKGLLRLDAGHIARTAILASDNARQDFNLANNDVGANDDWRTDFRQYVALGIWHIWTGFDHLLFLCSLLLPAVLMRQGNRWQGSTNLRSSLWDIARVVTAFTLAHSLTLSLAALGVVALPSRLIESAIAASVVLAAVNNLFPIIREGRWLLAFAFGLIHGFGFANVLNDLGLPQHELLIALVAFNIGVEIGQLALVSIFIPLVWRLREGVLYRRLVLNAGSFAIALVALLWFSERAFLLKLL